MKLMTLSLMELVVALKASPTTECATALTAPPDTFSLIQLLSHLFLMLPYQKKRRLTWGATGT